MRKGVDKRLWWAGAFALALLAALVLAELLLDDRPQREALVVSGESARAEAEVKRACEDAVSTVLVSPASMRIPENRAAVKTTDNQWMYIFAVDSQNGFGALIRSEWWCVYDGQVVTSLDRMR